MSNPGRRPLRIPLLFALPLSLWGAAAWLARDLRPWSANLTGIVFGAALLLTYLCLWGLVVTLSREPRLMFLRSISTTLVLSVLLVILELPALTGLLDYSYLLGKLAGDWTGPVAIFTTDLDLGFGRPPHVRWEGQPRSDMAVLWNLPARSPTRQTFTTDSRGFRNTRETARADVVFIGDSYVEGSYVSDEETVSSALEDLTRLPVTNLGRAGYGTLQELAVLRRYALPLKPRMVAWFFFEGNDLYNDEEFEGIRTYLQEHGGYDKSGKSKRQPFRKTSFSVYSFQFLRRLFHPIVPNVVSTVGWFQDETGRQHSMCFYDYGELEFTEYEEKRFATSRETLLEGDEVCRENGCKLIVFFVPMKFRVYGDYCTYPAHSRCTEWEPWDLADRFVDFGRESGLECVDLTVPMRRAAAAGKVLYAPEDSHWNPAGHRFVAELVRAAWLRHLQTGS